MDSSAVGGSPCVMSAASFAPSHPHRVITVLDVGAGAADIPVTLVRWARRHGRRLRVFALDRGRATLRYARAYTAPTRRSLSSRATLWICPCGRSRWTS
jgi:hypothetical protein